MKVSIEPTEVSHRNGVWEEKGQTVRVMDLGENGYGLKIFSTEEGKLCVQVISKDYDGNGRGWLKTLLLNDDGDGDVMVPSGSGVLMSKTPVSSLADFKRITKFAEQRQNKKGETK